MRPKVIIQCLRNRRKIGSPGMSRVYLVMSFVGISNKESDEDLREISLVWHESDPRCMNRH